MLNPELGFTSDVIRDSRRFVGRTDLILHCIRALDAPHGLIAIYGKRGVGKSSLLRQIQQMALGDYQLAKSAGLEREIPNKPRTYLTIYYSCDSMIKSSEQLLNRLCNDQDGEDGLLRLVPDDGKELVEFSRSIEANGGIDLKLAHWGAKGIETSKYAKIVPEDIVQTFRNFINSIILHQVKKRMGRDGILVLLDEFDVINNKEGLGSLIKSLSSPEVKFGICGIGHDLSDLVKDHASVERLLEQGVVYVKPMNNMETIEIINRAERLFSGNVVFDDDIKQKIAEVSEGYPYFAQMLGKACVSKINATGQTTVNKGIFDLVLDDIKSGIAFPTLESSYQRAIGHSPDRQLLLHLLADQPEENAMLNEDVGRVVLKKIRREAEDFEISNLDQLIPRLIDGQYGKVLAKIPEKQGVYEFTNPVFRLYVRLRDF